MPEETRDQSKEERRLRKEVEKNINLVDKYLGRKPRDKPPPTRPLKKNPRLGLLTLQTIVNDIKLLENEVTRALLALEDEEDPPDDETLSGYQTQGCSNKTRPSFTHPVLTGLTHLKKP